MKPQRAINAFAKKVITTTSTVERYEKGDGDTPHKADTHVPAYHVAAHLKDSPRPQECEQSKHQHHVLPAGAPQLNRKNHYTETNASHTDKRLEAVCLVAGNFNCLAHAIVAAE